tara:strand:+ start:100 stop:210 length:111 start_codon:yes stop_codon:yes gene_type:complete
VVEAVELFKIVVKLVDQVEAVVVEVLLQVQQVTHLQ